MSIMRSTLDLLVLASLGLAALQIYLTTNKLWKRKHEPAVAESVSIMGEFVGLIPVTVFTAKFALDGQWEGAADGVLWILAAGVAIAVGTGRWVEGRRQLGFLQLLGSALRLERGEVGYLAKSFLRPSGASHILRLLGRIALLDDHLDDRERVFVESFARGWGIDFDWRSVPTPPDDSALDFIPLRTEFEQYLATSPPANQVRQLSDVMHALVGADGTVSMQESLMMAELDGMMDAYLDAADRGRVHHAVVLVPQTPEQDQAIATVFPALPKRELYGGRVYQAGLYHSFDFAELVSAQYRALNFFTTVVRLTGADVSGRAAASSPTS